MCHTIENDRLRVQVADHGAELSALFDKAHQRQVLWTADAAHWNRHAPVLFPFVGRLYGNVYRHNGRQYAMSQHGFARDMDFTCLEEKADSVTHQLRATPETLQKYPFDFVLTITHRLAANTLQVAWTVQNAGADTMYFSIGGHPGFLCPARPGDSQTDYSLWLEGDGPFTCKTVDAASGTILPDQTFLLKTGPDGCLPITPHTFDHDALVFDDGQVTAVGLRWPDGSPYITLRCPDFPSLGVWSKPGCSAPFVCLEPWIGRCDDTGFTGELKDKYGVQTLAAGGRFERSYTITVD